MTSVLLIQLFCYAMHNRIVEKVVRIVRIVCYAMHVMLCITEQCIAVLCILGLGVRVGYLHWKTLSESIPRECKLVGG